MARKYYVDVVGTIGPGGLANAATTHTFTAPLTYANGITLPTLTGTDSFLLSIKDPTGRVTEVVEVTAYNQSTGVSTIARGKEGTSGVVHAAGDKVILSAYPSDLVGAVDVTTAPPSTIYQGLVWDGTGWVPSPVKVVRQSGLPDVAIIWSTTAVGGGATATWTPDPTVAVGDVAMYFHVGAAAPAATPAGWNLVYTQTNYTGFYGGQTRCFSRMLTSTDFTAGAPNAVTITNGSAAEQTWSVYYLRGLLVAPTSATTSGPASNFSGTITIPAQTASKAAPRMLFHSAVALSSSLTYVNLPTATQIPLGQRSNNSHLRTGLIEENTPATTTAYTSNSNRVEEVFASILLTPSATGPTKNPVDLLADLSDVAASGAASGNALTYNATTGTWQPAVPLTLKPATLHPTYGDDFMGASLNAKWLRAGAYVVGDETYTQGPVGSLLQVAPRSGGQSGGSYYYQTVSGLTDFTLEMRAFLIGGNSNYFPALVAFDSSSDGVSGCWHTLNFTAVQTQPVSDGVITGSGFTIGDARWSDHLTNGGLPFHVQLNRTGTAWKTRGSFGEVWTPWTATLTDSRTITRIGFSPTVYTDVPHVFYIDYFDVQT